MSDTYTPDPGHTPATITVPEDGDNLNANSVVPALEDLADLVANARDHAAKTNVDNNFSVKQTLSALDVLGAVLFKAVYSRETPASFTDDRVLVHSIGNSGNGHPIFRVYFTNTDAYELVFNGAWDQGTSAFVRDDAGIRTTRWAFSKNGLVSQSYAGVLTSITESDWTFALDMTLPTTGAKGKVFGSNSDGTVGFISSGIHETPKTVGAGGGYDYPYGSDWSAAGGPTRATQFFKDAFGVVHLEGSVTGNITGAGAPIVTLPSGYRAPVGKVISLLTVADTLGSDSQVPIVITIDELGRVIPRLTPGAATDPIAAGGLSLEGLTFRVG